MNLRRALSTFGRSAAFRLGSERAGKTLIDDLSSSDETVRTLAGMFLVRSGRRSLPILRETLTRREQIPTVLTMLADIGAPESESEIRAFVTDNDPDVARAAKQALDLLHRNLRKASGDT